MSTTTPKHDASAPKVGALDLDTYFHDIRENVHKLEQAYREDSLAQVIEEEGIEARFGKPLADCYRELDKPALPTRPQGPPCRCCPGAIVSITRRTQRDKHLVLCQDRYGRVDANG